MSSVRRAVFPAFQFPSPRGDKLCLAVIHAAAHHHSFRPLAGISCVLLQLILLPEKLEFPSPRGDKLCLVSTPPVKSHRGFPSPRGDKLCPVELKYFVPWAGFRPLAGISCV